MTPEERKSQLDHRESPHQIGEDQAVIGHQTANSLSEIADRLDTVLSTSWQRLATFIEHCEQILAREAGVSAQSAKLNEERRRCEQTQQREIEQIREECARLNEAWSRLEEFDRNRLGGRDEFQPSDNISENVQKIDPISRLAVIEADVAACQTDNVNSELSNVSVMQQFQQLKRDIGKHTRRKK